MDGLTKVNHQTSKILFYYSVSANVDFTSLSYFPFFLSLFLLLLFFYFFSLFLSLSFYFHLFCLSSFLLHHPLPYCTMFLSYPMFLLHHFLYIPALNLTNSFLFLISIVSYLALLSASPFLPPSLYFSFLLPYPPLNSSLVHILLAVRAFYVGLHQLGYCV